MVNQTSIQTNSARDCPSWPKLFVFPSVSSLHDTQRMVYLPTFKYVHLNYTMDPMGKKHLKKRKKTPRFPSFCVLLPASVEEIRVIGSFGLMIQGISSVWMERWPKPCWFSLGNILPSYRDCNEPFLRIPQNTNQYSAYTPEVSHSSGNLTQPMAQVCTSQV